MLPQVEFDPRYLPIINLSGETIPAFAIMKISGMDANQSLQIVKPNRDDENSGFLANEDSPIAVGAAGRGRVIQPFILDTNGEGSPPAVGEIWGVENGSWFLSRDRIGYKILALGQNSTRVLVERMDSQYITDLRVTDTANGTGNLSTYYPVIERKFDSVAQTWSENGTGYLQLSNAPTVNATYTGYRDGCNLLPTYRAIQGSTTTANATGSNVDRVRLIARVNNTTWNGTLLLPDPANSTTMNGTTVNVTFPGNISNNMGLVVGQEIIVQNTTVSNQTIRLPQWVSVAGNMERVRLSSQLNATIWSATLLLPDPTNGTTQNGTTVNITLPLSLSQGNVAFRSGLEITVQNTITANGSQTIRLPQWVEPYANLTVSGIVNTINQSFNGSKSLVYPNIRGSGGASEPFANGTVDVTALGGDGSLKGFSFYVRKTTGFVGTGEALTYYADNDFNRSVLYVLPNHSNLTTGNSAFSAFENNNQFVGTSNQFSGLRFVGGLYINGDLGDILGNITILQNDYANGTSGTIDLTTATSITVVNGRITNWA